MMWQNEKTVSAYPLHSLRIVLIFAHVAGCDIEDQVPVVPGKQENPVLATGLFLPVFKIVFISCTRFLILESLKMALRKSRHSH